MPNAGSPADGGDPILPVNGSQIEEAVESRNPETLCYGDEKMSKKMKRNIRSNGLFFLLTLVYVSGSGAGIYCISYLPETMISEIGSLAEKVFTVESGSFFPMFLSEFCSELLFLTVVMFSGFCALGQTVTVFAVALKAAANGLLCGIFFLRSGSVQLLEALELLFADGFLFAFLFLTASEASVRFSGNLFRQIFGREETVVVSPESAGISIEKSQEQSVDYAIDYIVKYFIFASFCALISALSAFFKLLLL